MTRRKKRYDELFNPPTSEDKERVSAVLEVIGNVVELLTERQQAFLFEGYPKARHFLMEMSQDAHARRRRAADTGRGQAG
jgi:hypothetical protein